MKNEATDCGISKVWLELLEEFEAMGLGKGDWLPISQIFPHLKLTKNGPFYGSIFFDLNWYPEDKPPASLFLIVREGENMVLSKEVKIKTLPRKERHNYPERPGMCRTSSIDLTIGQFGKIDNSPNISVTFSDGTRERHFDPYIISV